MYVYIINVQIIGTLNMTKYVFIDKDLFVY